MIFPVILTIINVITFFTYGLDKLKARRHAWRIPEKVLLGMALCLGSLGALAGMLLFHHKTKHWYFVVFVPLFLLLQTAIICCFYMGIIG